METEWLSINTENSEFSPVHYKDGFVYCSDKKNEIVKLVADKEHGNYSFDYYFSRPGIGGKWKNGELFSRTLNSPYNEGPLCFSGDFETVYFTRNQIEYKKKKDIYKETNRLGIFSANYVDSIWQEAIPFENNNPEYNLAHPSLSANGKELFFSSDLPGGYGSYDLYVCYYENGQWSKPVNLGSEINSEGKEAFPFIGNSDKLFFASDRSDGFGGLDIYCSNKTNEGWLKPILMDSNFNSKADDFGLVCDDNMEKGFYTSARGGSDDIYSFTFQYPEFQEVPELEYAVLCFSLQEETALLTDSMPLEYEWVMGDGTSLRGASIEHCYKEPGDYVIELNVINTISKEIFIQDASYDLSIEEIVQPDIFSADTVKLNEKVKFEAGTKRLPAFRSIEFYWTIDETTKRTGESVYYSFNISGIHKIILGVIAINESGEEVRHSVKKTVFVLD